MTLSAFGSGAVYLLGVLLATGSQLLLKQEALREHASRLGEYLNVRVISAYALLLLSTLCTVLALRKLPLSIAAVLGAMEYVFVTAAGAMLFHEKISARMAAGIGLIILGAVLTAL